MGLSAFMIVYGLIVCFGGIYIRKIVSALMGFAWSAIAGLMFMAFILLNYGGDEDGMVAGVLCFILICTFASAVYDRVCTAICAFLSAFSILFLIYVFMYLFTYDKNSFYSGLIIIALISMIPSGICFIIYNWAYILLTAFSGGFIASLGFVSITTGGDWQQFMYNLMVLRDSSAFGPVLLITLILGCCGTCVQFYRLSRRTAKTEDAINEEDENSDGEKVDDNEIKSKINRLSKNVQINLNSDDAQKELENFSEKLSEGADKLVNRMEQFFDNIIKDFIRLPKEIAIQKDCIILSIICFIIIPILYYKIHSVGLEPNVDRIFSDAFAYDITYYAYRFFTIIGFAGMIYLAFNRSGVFGIIYSVPFFISMNILNDHVSTGYKGYSIFIILFACLIVRKFLKNNIKYILGLWFFIVVNYFIVPNISTWSDYYGINNSNIVEMLALVITLVLLVIVNSMNKRNEKIIKIILLTLLIFATGFCSFVVVSTCYYWMMPGFEPHTEEKITIDESEEAVDKDKINDESGKTINEELEEPVYEKSGLLTQEMLTTDESYTIFRSLCEVGEEFDESNVTQIACLSIKYEFVGEKGSQYPKNQDGYFIVPKKDVNDYLNNVFGLQFSFDLICEDVGADGGEDDDNYFFAGYNIEDVSDFSIESVQISDDGLTAAVVCHSVSHYDTMQDYDIVFDVEAYPESDLNYRIVRLSKDYGDNITQENIESHDEELVNSDIDAINYVETKLLTKSKDEIENILGSPIAEYHLSEYVTEYAYSGKPVFNENGEIKVIYVELRASVITWLPYDTAVSFDFKYGEMRMNYGVHTSQTYESNETIYTWDFSEDLSYVLNDVELRGDSFNYQIRWHAKY